MTWALRVSGNSLRRQHYRSRDAEGGPRRPRLLRPWSHLRALGTLLPRCAPARLFRDALRGSRRLEGRRPRPAPSVRARAARLPRRLRSRPHDEDDRRDRSRRERPSGDGEPRRGCYALGGEGAGEARHGARRRRTESGIRTKVRSQGPRFGILHCSRPVRGPSLQCQSVKDACGGDLDLDCEDAWGARDVTCSSTRTTSVASGDAIVRIDPNDCQFSLHRRMGAIIILQMDRQRFVSKEPGGRRTLSSR